jgi:hypothetical protein
MNISMLVWNFIQEIIHHSDNNPTKFSVLSYAYFQLLYNIGTLFEKNGVKSDDRVLPSIPLDELNNNISNNRRNALNLLQTYLYTAHNAFLLKLYPDVKLFSHQDYGLTKIVNVEKTVLETIKNYAESHILGKEEELKRAMFTTKNTTGLAADYTGNIFSQDPNSEQNNNWDTWEQLVVPTGFVKGSNDLPLIDSTIPSSLKVQNFLGSEFYKNAGFAVNPTEKIIDLDSKISKTWDTGLQKETDLLLDVYKNLTEEQKVIAEFFAGSSKRALPPPGFFICIAMQLSQKYKQTIMNDLKMYFSVAAGLFDACVSAWYYKSIYKQARPVNLIRRHYADQKITTWTPLSTEKSSEINGRQWLPYQPLTFVTPPFPDVASGHTTFSSVASKILNWWFNNPVLYDGCSLSTMPNQQSISPLLNINDKIVCIGEYIFDKGCSEIESGTTPKNRIVLRYNNLDELANMAGLSRVYGGIHTFETNKVSAELGAWVFEQTHNKLINEFKFKSPYSL